VVAVIVKFVPLSGLITPVPGLELTIRIRYAAPAGAFVGIDVFIVPEVLEVKDGVSVVGEAKLPKASDSCAVKVLLAGALGNAQPLEIVYVSEMEVP